MRSSGLVAAEAEEWSHYIGLLNANFITLIEDDPDTLCWSKKQKTGDFTTKMGYKWWWSLIWKISDPLKCRITLWLPLNNKLLTWENGLKQGW